MRHPETGADPLTQASTACAKRSAGHAASTGRTGTRLPRPPRRARVRVRAPHDVADVRQGARRRQAGRSRRFQAGHRAQQARPRSGRLDPSTHRRVQARDPGHLDHEAGASMAACGPDSVRASRSPEGETSAWEAVRPGAEAGRGQGARRRGQANKRCRRMGSSLSLSIHCPSLPRKAEVASDSPRRYGTRLRPISSANVRGG